MVSLDKVTLDKKGESRTISLKKEAQTQTIHVNLNWDARPAPKKGFLASVFGGGGGEPDLDLGVMFRMKNSQMGVIQPLGGNFGAKDRPPFIFLDKDDRSGAASDGENLFIYRPQDIDLLVVFALIYEGAKSFQEVGGRVTLKDANGSETVIHLTTPEANKPMCVVASLRPSGEGLAITKEERYFSGHPDADRAFGFGFRWEAGSK